MVMSFASMKGVPTRFSTSRFSTTSPLNVNVLLSRVSAILVSPKWITVTIRRFGELTVTKVNGGPRFGRSQIQLNVYLACAHEHSPAFICSDVALVTHVTSAPSLLKTLTAHARLFKTDE